MLSIDPCECMLRIDNMLGMALKELRIEDSEITTRSSQVGVFGEMSVKL